MGLISRVSSRTYRCIYLIFIFETVLAMAFHDNQFSGIHNVDFKQAASRLDANKILQGLGYEFQRRNRNAHYLPPNNPPFHPQEVYLFRFRLNVPVITYFGYHWGLVVVDADGKPWIYEINQPEDVDDCSSKSMMERISPFKGRSFEDAYFMGFTDKSHDWIETWMKKYTSQRRYNVLSQNCQHMCKDLLKDLKLENEQPAPMTDVTKGLVFAGAAALAYGIMKWAGGDSKETEASKKKDKQTRQLNRFHTI